MAAVTFTRVSAELRQRYLAAWESNKDDPRRVDGPGQHPLIGNAEVMVIAGSAEAAREIAMRGQAGLGRRIRQAHEYDQRVIPPDELEGALGARRFQQGRRPLDATVAGRQLPAGTVGMVRDNYVAYAGEGNCDYVLLMLPTGDMTHLEAMHSLERFCEEVLPSVSAV
jgi:hypothetical protein